MLTTRRIMIALLTLALLLLAAAAIVGPNLIWAFTVRPKPTINYRERLAAQIADTQKPGADGTTPLIEVLQLQGTWRQLYEDDLEAQLEDYDHNQICFGPYPRDNLAGKLRTLRQLDELGIAAPLDAVADADRFIPSLETDPQSDADPASLQSINLAGGFSQVRGVLWTRIATMRIASHRADWPDHLRATRHALALSAATDTRSLLIDRLIAIGQIQSVLREIRWGALDRPYPAAHSRALITEINRRLPLRPFQVILDAERLFTDDGLQQMYDGPPGTDARLIVTAASRIAGFDITKEAPDLSEWSPGAAKVSWTANLKWRQFPRRLAAEQTYEDVFAAAANRLKLPHPRGKPDPVPSANWLIELNMLGADVARVFQTAADTDEACRADVAGTLLLLAIEHHRALHEGIPPAHLDELVPAILPSLPKDPYAPDERFRYRLLTPADNDPHARPYLLYSVGPDARDNDAHDDADPFALPFVNAKTGTDIVINQPRAPERVESEP